MIAGDKLREYMSILLEKYTPVADSAVIVAITKVDARLQKYIMQLHKLPRDPVHLSKLYSSLHSSSAVNLKVGVPFVSVS